MSPRIGLYPLKLVLNCNKTSAKISILVTILQMKSLIKAKQVKSGPSKFFHQFSCVTTNGLIFQKTPLIKFIWLLKWSCLGHNKMNQAKNPECQAGRVDIAVEQCDRILAHSWEVVLLNHSFGLGSQSEEGLEAIINSFYKISKISQFLTKIDKVWTDAKQRTLMDWKDKLFLTLL